MRKGLGIVFLGLAVVLCQCDGQSVDMHKRQKSHKAPDDSMAFDIRLELTSAAKARLHAEDSAVVVAVAYYGLPTPAGMSRANRLHEIDLGDERQGVGADVASVHMTGGLDRSQLVYAVDGQAYLLASAFSVTSGGAANEIIVCNSYRGSIQQAQTPGAAVVLCDVAPPEVDNSSKYVP